MHGISAGTEHKILTPEDSIRFAR